MIEIIKKIDSKKFQNELVKELSLHNIASSQYDLFQNIFEKILNDLKEKRFWSNHRPFQNIELRNVIMTFQPRNYSVTLIAKLECDFHQVNQKKNKETRYSGKLRPRF